MKRLWNKVIYSRWTLLFVLTVVLALSIADAYAFTRPSPHSRHAPVTRWKPTLASPTAIAELTTKCLMVGQKINKEQFRFMTDVDAIIIKAHCQKLAKR